MKYVVGILGVVVAGVLFVTVSKVVGTIVMALVVFLLPWTPGPSIPGLAAGDGGDASGDAGGG